MKIHLLGTGGYHPSERRHTACMMLPSEGIVLDAGTAFFRVRDHLVTDHLDIFLSHVHLDHVMGLTFLYDVLAKKNVANVTIHGAPDKLQAIQDHLYSDLLFPVKPPWEFRPLQPSLTFPSGCKITHFPLKHPGGSIGFRLDWPDRSLAYVTDTTATADSPYIEQIRGVDLLIHECYFDDTMPEQAELTGHSCITPVVQLAANAKVKRLVLVHVNPLDERADPVGLPAARRIFAATELATDGMVVEF